MGSEMCIRDRMIPMPKTISLIVPDMIAFACDVFATNTAELIDFALAFATEEITGCRAENESVRVLRSHHFFESLTAYESREFCIFLKTTDFSKVSEAFVQAHKYIQHSENVCRVLRRVVLFKNIQCCEIVQ